ncbi:MAG: LD-carboxypeptidase [Bacteroidales bacterium]|nr:LD-carboxypeptidase [Bacteroidales bacterium]
MITPPYLEKGDTVGIIAPARKITKAEIEGFLQILRLWDLKWKTGEHLFGEHFVFSGSDEERASDLQAMIDDKDVKAIFCARGGYGSVRTLQQADFSSFEKNPKWLVGFSDITVLHSYINKFTGVETIHGMMPFHFKPDSDAESIESLRKALFGDPLSYEFPSHELNIEGSVEGELVGGNLSLLCSLNGTILFPDLKNKILFIEEVDEYLYNIDRMMMNLSLGGAFNRARALVVGSFTGIKDNDEPFGRNEYEIISEISDHYNIPVCFNFPAGHGFRNNALIFGRKMQLRVEENKTSLKFYP